MKGFVPTPDAVVDLMVGKLFAHEPPTATSRVLDPGCGNGEFIAGVLRACANNNWPVPQIVGIELDDARARFARSRFRGVDQVTIRKADFLRPSAERFDFVIGNPPYVSILALGADERLAYRAAYRTASGRFDLYVLFFEQALRLLAPSGRVVFITPEKFLYVETAKPLRELLRATYVEELHFASEDTFENRVAYPLISTVTRAASKSSTRVIRRDGRASMVSLDVSSSWLPLIEGFEAASSSITLADASLRISCGVATGADAVFVLPTDEVPHDLRKFAHPTVSGRQITAARGMDLQTSILTPYDARGNLIPETHLGALGRFLRTTNRRSRLNARSCVTRKPWYAFHDNLPLGDMLRPKLLCKDITETPFFVIDYDGSIVPRHSVYYIVPNNPLHLEPLAEYLNSEAARDWLRAHCQRAAGGFLRLQSHVLKQLPVPAEFANDTLLADMMALESRPA